MKKIIFLATCLLIMGCDDDGAGTFEKPVGHVILYRDGQAKKSPVYNIGSRCWVSWYDGIEKVLIHGNGTAFDTPFSYRWTLDRKGPDDTAADAMWFKNNCAEPLS